MRSHSVFGAILAAISISPAAVLAASGSGSSTRYWDCCKPSCAWPEKASLLQGPVTTCDRNGNRISADAKSGCQSGGSAYTCTNAQPWAVNDQVAFGFAATAISGGSEASWCCACYKLTFTSGPVAGKTMVVQSVNTGGDLSGNQFDLQMPGGGVGLFDGCTSQFGQSLPGAQYGGISSRSQCAQMPQALQKGCYWRFDWFQNADNPRHNFEQVQCPSELVAISGCKRSDDRNFPAFQMPQQPATTTTRPPSQTSSPPTGGGGGGGGGAAQWAQCGGIGWSGTTSCQSPYTCTKINDYYSQCL